MTNLSQKIVALNSANVEAAVTLGNIALDGLKRFYDLQFSTANAVLADASKLAGKVAQVKDAQSLSALQASLPGFEKSVAYVRSAYEIAAQSQEAAAAVLEKRVTDFNDEVIAALEEVAKSAPNSGADAAVAAVKSAVAAANSAYETVSKAAKQVAEQADSNISALTAKVVANAKKKVAA